MSRPTDPPQYATPVTHITLVVLLTVLFCLLFAGLLYAWLYPVSRLTGRRIHMGMSPRLALTNLALVAFPAATCFYIVALSGMSGLVALGTSLAVGAICFFGAQLHQCFSFRRE
ncbi:hypothetical protein JNJ66_06155 [Candidatus Saccharibacteria bacterium]|nr:hypothetical protein [Candidatus Saccharibacteria bacterium]